MKKALSLFLCLLLPVLMLAACGQPADDRTPEELFSSGILAETFRTPLNRIWTEGGWRYYYD